MFYSYMPIVLFNRPLGVIFVSVLLLLIALIVSRGFWPISLFYLVLVGFLLTKNRIAYYLTIALSLIGMIVPKLVSGLLYAFFLKTATLPIILPDLTFGALIVLVLVADKQTREYYNPPKEAPK